MMPENQEPAPIKIEPVLRRENADDDSLALPNVTKPNVLKNSVMSAVAGAAILAGVTNAEGKPPVPESGVPVFKVVQESVKVGSVKPSEQIFIGKYLDAWKGIDKSKVTPSSAWASELLKKVTKAQDMVKSGTDAMSYLKAGYGAFARQYQETISNAAGCSAEDCLEIARDAQGLLDEFERAFDAYGVNRTNMDTERSYLTDAITRLQSTYDNKKAAETAPKFQF